MINITLNMADVRRLGALATQFPRQTYRGLGRAGATIRGKLRKVMRSGGGSNGVPTFQSLDQVTLMERRAAGSRVRKIGGVLSKSFAIQMFRKGKGQFTVGFISGLEPWARMFQNAEHRQLTKNEIIRFARLGINVRNYDRPARIVLPPFSKIMGRLLIHWTIRNTEKILEKAQARA